LDLMVMLQAELFLCHILISSIKFQNYSGKYLKKKKEFLFVIDPTPSRIKCIAYDPQTGDQFRYFLYSVKELSIKSIYINNVLCTINSSIVIN